MSMMNCLSGGPPISAKTCSAERCVLRNSTFVASRLRLRLRILPSVVDEGAMPIPYGATSRLD